MNFLRVTRSRFETPPRKGDSLATELSAFLNAFAAEINFGQIQIRFDRLLLSKVQAEVIRALLSHSDAESIFARDAHGKNQWGPAFNNLIGSCNPFKSLSLGLDKSLRVRFCHHIVCRWKSGPL